MHRPIMALASVAVIALGGAVAVLAQSTAPGGDLEALVQSAEANAARASGSVDRWVKTLQGRGDAYEKDAGDLAAHNREQVAKGMGMMDDPALRAASGPMANGPAAKTGLYVAVSLSMPPETLRALAADARRAHAQLVIRGLIGNSFKETAIRMKQVFSEASTAGVAIDPQVFRAFNVTSVPTFIASATAVQPCRGLGCVTPTPRHDELRGNISLLAALTELSRDGDSAREVSGQALARLKS